MATETFDVIEADGSSNQVTLTEDPVENATVQAVKNAIGDESIASQSADSAVSATLIERVTALLDTLQSGQADDALRAVGNVSHDSADTGNPLKIGVLYAPSQDDVDDGDRADVRGTQKGDVSIAPLHHGDDSVEVRLPTLEDATTATGSSNAAEIRATGGRTQVSVAWDTSGASTITVEVSPGGGTWFDRTHDVIPSQPGSAEQRAETLETGFRHVRVYADSSLNELLISAKGL